MIPIVPLLAAPPTVARDADLVWSFDGAVRREAGRYDLVGRDLRGEIVWFVAPKGRYDAKLLYERDTQRTKEADAAKGFRHVRTDGLFAGMPAIRSDQTYLWDGASVVSRCLYCAKGARAWVVRLWWPAARPGGAAEADAFLKTVRVVS